MQVLSAIETMSVSGGEFWRVIYSSASDSSSPQQCTPDDIYGNGNMIDWADTISAGISDVAKGISIAIADCANGAAAGGIIGAAAAGGPGAAAGAAAGCLYGAGIGVIRDARP